MTRDVLLVATVAVVESSGCPNAFHPTALGMSSRSNKSDCRLLFAWGEKRRDTFCGANPEANVVDVLLEVGTG